VHKQQISSKVNLQWYNHHYQRYCQHHRHHWHHCAVASWVASDCSLVSYVLPSTLTNPQTCNIPPHHNRFTALFPGPTRWAGARRTILLEFMVLGRITRGRHTNNPGGRHSIRTNQQSTSINPPFLCRMPFLPQPSQLILAWNRHRNMLDCIPPWIAYPLHTSIKNYLII